MDVPDSTVTDTAGIPSDAFSKDKYSKNLKSLVLPSDEIQSPYTFSHCSPVRCPICTGIFACLHFSTTHLSECAGDLLKDVHLIQEGDERDAVEKVRQIELIFGRRCVVGDINTKVGEELEKEMTRLEIQMWPRGHALPGGYIWNADDECRLQDVVPSISLSTSVLTHLKVGTLVREKIREEGNHDNSQNFSNVMQTPSNIQTPQVTRYVSKSGIPSIRLPFTPTVSGSNDGNNILSSPQQSPGTLSRHAKRKLRQASTTATALLSTPNKKLHGSSQLIVFERDVLRKISTIRFDFVFDLLKSLFSATSSSAASTVSASGDKSDTMPNTDIVKVADAENKDYENGISGGGGGGRGGGDSVVVSSTGGNGSGEHIKEGHLTSTANEESDKDSDKDAETPPENSIDAVMEMVGDSATWRRWIDEGDKDIEQYQQCYHQKRAFLLPHITLFDHK